MNNEIIKNEFTIKLDREGYSIYVKEVDRTAIQEKNMEIFNGLVPLQFKDALYLGKTVEQIVLTRSDKVEVSIIKVEGLPYEWELCVFDDEKGKVKGALKNEPLEGIETAKTKDEVLKRAVELLTIV